MWPGHHKTTVTVDGWSGHHKVIVTINRRPNHHKVIVTIDRQPDHHKVIVTIDRRPNHHKVIVTIDRRPNHHKVIVTIGWRPNHHKVIVTIDRWPQTNSKHYSMTLSNRWKGVFLFSQSRKPVHLSLYREYNRAEGETDRQIDRQTARPEELCKATTVQAV